jgi:hypothetical protein
MANALVNIDRHVDIENSVHKAEYERQLKRLRGQSNGVKGKLGPEAVYDALKHALTAKHPRPHYIITKPARRGALLKRLLPSGLFYKILASLG